MRKFFTAPVFQALVVAALLVVSFCLYTTGVQDGDLFWHLRAGRWIWEHKSLPNVVSYLPGAFQNLSPQEKVLSDFTLQQYWLAQLLFYGIWHWLGLSGIILLRALCYTSVLFLLFYWMKERTKARALPFLLLFLTASLFSFFPNERPQLLTFLFLPVTLYLLEQLHGSDRIWTRAATVLLPVVMLIWANCHGGYVVGVAILSIFLLNNLAVMVFRRERASLPPTLVILASCLCTLINPYGTSSLFTFISNLSGASATNLEFLSPMMAARELGAYFPSYWIFLVVAAALFIRRRGRYNPAHLLTLALLIGLSLTALRNLMFPLLASPLLLSQEDDEPAYGWAVPPVLLSLLIMSSNFQEVFAFGPDRTFPSKATAFLRATQPASPLFNHYDWGGYLGLHLPEYQVFIDGSGLYERNSKSYDQVLLTGHGKQVLDSHGINTVVIPGVSKSRGITYPLVEELYLDRNWLLVYRDDSALVFLRNTEINRKIADKHRLEKEEIFRHVIQRLDKLRHLSAGAEYWVSKGNAHFMLRELDQAKAAYKEAVMIDPGNEGARKMLAQLGSK